MTGPARVDHNARRAAIDAAWQEYGRAVERARLLRSLDQAEAVVARARAELDAVVRG